MYKRPRNQENEKNVQPAKTQKTSPKKTTKTTTQKPLVKAKKIEGFCIVIGETERVFQLNVNEHFLTFSRFFELTLKNFSLQTIKIQATNAAEYQTAIVDIEKTLCGTKYPIVYLIVLAQENVGPDFTAFLKKIGELKNLLPEIVVGVLPESDVLLSKLDDQKAVAVINYRKIAFNNFSDHGRMNIITVSDWSDKLDPKTKCTTTNRINRLFRKICKFEPERNSLLRVNTTAVAGKISSMSSKAAEMLAED